MFTLLGDRHGRTKWARILTPLRMCTRYCAWHASHTCLKYHTCVLATRQISSALACNLVCVPGQPKCLCDYGCSRCRQSAFRDSRASRLNLDAGVCHINIGLQIRFSHVCPPGGNALSAKGQVQISCVCTVGSSRIMFTFLKQRNCSCGGQGAGACCWGARGLLMGRQGLMGVVRAAAAQGGPGVSSFGWGLRSRNGNGDRAIGGSLVQLRTGIGSWAGSQMPPLHRKAGGSYMGHTGLP